MTMCKPHLWSLIVKNQLNKIELMTRPAEQMVQDESDSTEQTEDIQTTKAHDRKKRSLSRESKKRITLQKLEQEAADRWGAFTMSLSFL